MDCHAGLSVAGKKLLVSLAMEGKFATDGLQAIDEGGDILMAMARELVTEKGIGESADAVWKLFRERNSFHYSGPKTTPSEEPTLYPIPTVEPIRSTRQLVLFE
jgi:hypothetical protein